MDSGFHMPNFLSDSDFAMEIANEQEATIRRYMDATYYPLWMIQLTDCILPIRTTPELTLQYQCAFKVGRIPLRELSLGLHICSAMIQAASAMARRGTEGAL